MLQMFEFKKIFGEHIYFLVPPGWTWELFSNHLTRHGEVLFRPAQFHLQKAIFLHYTSIQPARNKTPFNKIILWKSSQAAVAMLAFFLGGVVLLPTGYQTSLYNCFHFLIILHCFAFSFFFCIFSCTYLPAKFANLCILLHTENCIQFFGTH